MVNEHFIDVSQRHIAKIVWEESIAWSYTDLSIFSGLAPTTCRNFLLGRTRRPQYRTVALLARSIGVDIAFNKNAQATQPKLRVVRAARKKKLKRAS